MLHKVLLKRHAIIEHDGEHIYFAAGEHLVAPEIGRKLTTEVSGGVLIEKHDSTSDTVEAVKPTVVDALANGQAPETAVPETASAKKAETASAKK